MTHYRGALGVLALATSGGCVVVWGRQVAIYPSVEEARLTVGALDQCRFSEAEADWVAVRVAEAEQRLKRVMWP